MDIIGMAESLSKLGIVTILLAMVIALAFYIYKTTTQDRERTDILITLVGEVKTDTKLHHEFVKEQQKFMKDFIEVNIDHYREQNIKCKEDILASIREIKGDIEDIKIAMIKA